ncbi:MAG: hypothetical protein LAN61_09050 [Acidobacteriia bacterium]|nr:hypothetical protein [Terriglobia bacterium]
MTINTSITAGCHSEPAVFWWVRNPLLASVFSFCHPEPTVFWRVRDLLFFLPVLLFLPVFLFPPVFVFLSGVIPNPRSLRVRNLLLS